MTKLGNFQELGDVLEPFDPNYISNKPYEIPQISSRERRFLHKVSIIERKLRKNHVSFKWLENWECFRVHKFIGGSEYPTYRYVRVNMEENDYSFGTENEDLVFDGHASVVIDAVVEWLSSDEKPQIQTKKGWRVLPLGYHVGFCPTLCKTKCAAEEQAKVLTKQTGFEWRVVRC